MISLFILVGLYFFYPVGHKYNARRVRKRDANYVQRCLKNLRASLVNPANPAMIDSYPYTFLHIVRFYPTKMQEVYGIFLSLDYLALTSADCERIIATVAPNEVPMLRTWLSRVVS